MLANTFDAGTNFHGSAHTAPGYQAKYFSISAEMAHLQGPSPKNSILGPICACVCTHIPPASGPLHSILTLLLLPTLPVGPGGQHHGPVSVIATVCSKWALGRPSAVTCVQWSACSAPPWSPCSPSAPRRSPGPAPGGNRLPRRSWLLAKFGTCGSSCIFAADAVADKRLDDRKTVLLDVGFHLAGHFAPPFPLAHQLDGQVQARRGSRPAAGAPRARSAPTA